MQHEHMPTITVVEDDPVMGESLVQSLSLEGYRVNWCETSRDATHHLKTNAASLVICDIRLPDGSGEELFNNLARQYHDDLSAPSFLFMTGYGDIDQAVRLMRAGAGDYLTKPFDMGDFLNRVDGLIQPRMGQSNKRREDEPLLGLSSIMQTIEQALHRLAGGHQPLLLTGETGVGKEYAARLCHELSPRSGHPFIAVNCAIIPEHLLAHELFGGNDPAAHESANTLPPYVERVGNGTLFLDGLGQLSLKLQSKLLRLMEEGVFEKSDGSGPAAFEGRLLFATRRDLDRAVQQGSFRADLWQQVSDTRLHIPPLRDRTEDVSMHLDRCLREFGAVAMGRLHGLSAAAETAALDHDWPHNVSELRHRMERAMALALGEWITPLDLFPERGFGSWKGQPEVTSLAQARNMAERRQIERALALHEGHMSKAATTLGISRTTLWEKMKRLGLDQNH